MSEWAPSIVLIEKIDPHPGADLLSVATVNGDYPVVIKTGDYKVGDAAGYIPIDSICPDLQEYYFLCPKAYEKYEEDGEIKQRQVGFKYEVGLVPERYRIIRAKRLRGIYSMGMLVKAPEGLNVGESIVDVLGLKKWEEPEEDNIPNAKKSRGTNAAPPPKGWSVPYYDIEAVRKYSNCLQENEEIVIQEKLHGSNMAAVFDGETFYVKSRNYYKKFDLDDPWIDASVRYDLENKLKKYPMFIGFCELYGTVKGFRYDCELVNGAMPAKIRFFDIYNAKTNRYIDYDDFLAITTELELPVVPELYRGPYLNKDALYAFAEGQTTLGGKHIREGVVVKTVKERFEPRLGSRCQLKLIGQGYSLQK